MKHCTEFSPRIEIIARYVSKLSSLFVLVFTTRFAPQGTGGGNATFFRVEVENSPNYLVPRRLNVPARACRPIRTRLSSSEVSGVSHLHICTSEWCAVHLMTSITMKCFAFSDLPPVPAYTAVMQRQNLPAMPAFLHVHSSQMASPRSFILTIYAVKRSNN